jgi:hypothetical protein
MTLRERLDDALEELDASTACGNKINTLYWAAMVASLAAQLSSDIITDMSLILQIK